MERKAGPDLREAPRALPTRQVGPPLENGVAVPPRAGRAGSPAGAGRRRAVQLSALGLLSALTLGVLLSLPQAAPPHSQAQAPLPVFKDWDRPEVVVVLSGQQHGYLQPCGCSEPQYGGLARRYNLIQSLKDRGWPVVAVDLGDVPQRTGPASQKLDKHTTSMQALQKMGYAAVGLGQNEMALGTVWALSHFSLNDHSPRVLAANLLGRKDLFVDMVGAWVVGGKDRTPRVGVVGLIGPSVARQVKDPDVKLHPKTRDVVRETLDEMKVEEARRGKLALTVLLYQGSLEEATECAKFCADLRKSNPGLPRVDVILCLTDEDTAPALPTAAGESMIVRVGHKGKSIGVVGAFRKGGGHELRYQMVELGPRYDTPKGRETSNPVMVMMEDYARRVKDKHYLADHRQVAHAVQVAFPESTYVGSEKCRSCHKEAFAVWTKSAHFHAYEALEKAKNPSLRQYDPECVKCHVVGFDYNNGYLDEVKTPHLKNVGCESCHGPASEHWKNPGNEAVRAALNPWKARPGEAPAVRQRRQLQIDLFCQKCHDVDNDVHWDFNKTWPKVVHTLDGGSTAVQPPANGPALQPAAPPQTEAHPTSGRRIFRSRDK